MGNCMSNNKISAQDHEIYHEAKIEKKIKTSPSSKFEAPRWEQSMKKKVRFKIQNDDEGDRGNHGGDSRGGAVRIRVVMTQEELKRMLSCKDDAQDTLLDQLLLGAMKLRGGRVFEVGGYDGGMNSWRPTLESIPEDCLLL